MCGEKAGYPPFLSLPDQGNVRPALTATFRLARVLGAVKHVDLSGDRFRRNEVGVLGHITRPVDLALVIDFLNDVDARLWRDGVATELATLVVVVRAFELIGGGAVIALWEMYFSDLEVILCLAGRVRAEQKAVDGVGLIRGPALHSDS